MGKLQARRPLAKAGQTIRKASQTIREAKETAEIEVRRLMVAKKMPRRPFKRHAFFNAQIPMGTLRRLAPCQKQHRNKMRLPRQPRREKVSTRNPHRARKGWLLRFSGSLEFLSPALVIAKRKVTKYKHMARRMEEQQTKRQLKLAVCAATFVAQSWRIVTAAPTRPINAGIVGLVGKV